VVHTVSALRRLVRDENNVGSTVALCNERDGECGSARAAGELEAVNKVRTANGLDRVSVLYAICMLLFRARRRVCCGARAQATLGGAFSSRGPMFLN
jgi:hypothetical protein